MTVNFSLISNRRSPPVPWSSELRFPWDDSDFSDRMLREHLYQGHDLASRRHALIRREVEWIHNELLRKKSSRILDLCCGPGLYLERLASSGHKGHGVDFSPSAIRYARSVSTNSGQCLKTQNETPVRCGPGRTIPDAPRLAGSSGVSTSTSCLSSGTW